jgi:hypothetical protein
MKITFRTHAVRRMFERAVSPDEVRAVLATGETIADYPDDSPYPSRLVLGWRGGRPLHVVAAYNATDDETIVVTVYEPVTADWEPDFRRKKQ